jgi:mRNA-degrading endonuclease toxin of MazEF toxin-antitoxin module
MSKINSMRLNKVLKEALKDLPISRQGIPMMQRSGQRVLSKGHIAFAPFPFSDRDESKIRPCLVLAKKGDDVICAYMSSKFAREGILIKPVDLDWNELNEPNALVRPDKLATIDIKRFGKIVGRLVEPKRKEIVSRINTLIQ